MSESTSGSGANRLHGDQCAEGRSKGSISHGCRVSLFLKKAGLRLAFAALILALAAPAAEAAPSVAISATAKIALDKTIAAAGEPLGSRLAEKYGNLLDLQQREERLDEAVRAAHAGNAERLLAVNAAIKRVDAAKLEALEQQAARAKERYRPLFELYSSLNRQIPVARALGGKHAAALVQAQAEGVRPAVQLARFEIRSKEAALRAAKDNAGRTARQIRGTLAAIEPVNVQIRADRSAAAALKKSAAAVSSALNRSLKSGDAKAAESALSSLVALAGHIAETKQKLLERERRIGGIIGRAEAQLP